MADLRTDYKDDVLNITTNERRKYRMINNADGTISFEDVTDYVQKGDSFGATDVNAITEKVNRCLTSADVVDNLESTETKLPLSANQGRELMESISALTGSARKIYTGTATVSVNGGKSKFLHNFNIANGRYSISVSCISNQNFVFHYLQTANEIGLYFFDTSFGAVTGDRSISYALIEYT